MKRNPVRRLTISEAERKRMQREVQSMFSSRGKSIRNAAKLYTDFTGHDDPRISKIKVEKRSKVMLLIGDVDGILYTTVRDGLTEKYIHKFKRQSRPQLLASPDGKQLYLLGGAYDFTERGIVDKT